MFGENKVSLVTFLIKCILCFVSYMTTNRKVGGGLTPLQSVYFTAPADWFVLLERKEYLILYNCMQ